MIIAIDGPAGAGKSTTARGVAERFGFAYVNTGAMYRAVALAAAEQGLRLPDDAAAIIDLARGLPLTLKDNGDRICIGERDVTDLITARDVTDSASVISTIDAVRAVVVEQQRRLAQCGERDCGGAVLEGRDIQTVVCPEAEVKIFLTADSHTRAQRRLVQQQVNGAAESLSEVRQAIEMRDERDRSREASPLRAAPDAVHVVTDDLSPAQVIERIAAIVQDKMALPSQAA